MRYYGVTAVRRHGEKFLGWEDFTDEHMRHPQIPEGRRLIAIIKDVAAAKEDACFEVAGDVTEPPEWEELLEAYAEVAFSTVEFWTIQIGKLVLCPNEGRVFH